MRQEHLIRPNTICQHTNLDLVVIDTIGTTNNINTLIRRPDGQRIVVLTTDLTNWSLRNDGNGDGEIFKYQRYTDTPAYAERYVATPMGGEIQRWDDRYTNPDVPDNRAFLDMGQSDQLSALLDEREGWQDTLNGKKTATAATRSMNCADFRERCVTYGNRLFAIYEKRKADYAPPWFKNQERLATMFNIPMDVAHRLARLMGPGPDGFSFNAPMANRLFRGHTTIDGERRSGLACATGNAELMSRFIDQLEKLNNSANESLPLDSDPAPTHMDEFYDERLIYAVDEVLDADQDQGDGLDDDSAPDGYGAHPLSDGRDSLDYEIVDEIKSADAEQIILIQRRMFPVENAYTGRVYAAEYSWMTAAQKSIVWAFIKARKIKLAQEGMRSFDKQARDVMRLARELGKRPQARALIATWAAGKTFNMCGVRMEFTQPTKQAIYAMWAVYRKL